MPVKTFDFTFKLDVQELLAYVAEKHVQVNIALSGTKRPPPEVNGEAQEVLALPAPTGKQPKSQDLVLSFMARHPKEKYSVDVIRALLTQCNRSPDSSGNIIFILMQGKWIRSLNGPGRKGEYKITVKGLKRAKGIQ